MATVCNVFNYVCLYLQYAVLAVPLARMKTDHVPTLATGSANVSKISNIKFSMNVELWLIKHNGTLHESAGSALNN